MNMDAANDRQNFPPIYEHPHGWASHYGESEKFQASYTLNCDCAAAINRTLAKHYDFDTGHPDLAPTVKEIVDKFGFDRTMYVLANAVWDYTWNGGISKSNEQWALTIPNYDEPYTSRDYAVKGDPDVIDRLISQVRQDYMRTQQPQAHDHDEPISPQEIANMSEEALHTVLLKRLGEEQSTFRSQLLSQTPEEILNKAAEYSAREDILSMMHWRTLDKPGYMALLTSPAALDALYAVAEEATTLGITAPSTAAVIATVLDVLEILLQNIRRIEQNIKALVKQETYIQQNLHLLQTIPGIGFNSALVILSEIGDFSLFHKPKQLAAYFGLDPGERQSGKFRGSKNKMSKRGSTRVRAALHMAAVNAVAIQKKRPACNPVLAAYYNEKCKSKPGKVAMCAVMHKISNIIFAVLRDQQPFELRQPQEHIQRLGWGSKE